MGTDVRQPVDVQQLVLNPYLQEIGIATQRKGPTACPGKVTVGPSKKALLSVNSTTKSPAAQARRETRRPADMSHKLAWLKAVHAADNLSPAAKNVAVALFMHHNAKTGLCCVKQATLGDDVALERGRVNRVVRELKDAGWITAEQTMGASYYILHVERAGSREPAELCRIEDTSDEASYVGSDTPSVSDPAHQVCPILHTEQSTSTVPSNRLSLRAPAGTKPRGQTNASGGARARSVKGEGMPWPDDLELDDAARQVAQEAGITQDIERVWSRFRNHALDKGRKSHNWPSAWQTWCETAHDHHKRDAARQPAAREQSKPSRFQIPRNGAYPPQAA